VSMEWIFLFGLGYLKIIIVVFGRKEVVEEVCYYLFFVLGEALIEVFSAVFSSLWMTSRSKAICLLFSGD
jgi:hypothetical protein